MKQQKEESDVPVINANALPDGNLQGAEHGATTSVILDHSEPGQGPRLHKHPYDETWVVNDGAIAFQAGDEQFEAGPGEHRDRPTRDAAQVHQQRPRAGRPRMHPRQPHVRHGVAGMNATATRLRLPSRRGG